MADAVLVQIADAVTAALNGASAGTFAADFTAVRSYADWDDQLTDAEQLRVDVVPFYAPTLELDGRGFVGGEAMVDIGIRKKFSQAEQESTTGRISAAAVDELLLLVEQVARYLVTDRFTALDSTCGAVWQKTEVRAAYIRDHLRLWGQFTGYVRLTFSTHEVKT